MASLICCIINFPKAFLALGLFILIKAMFAPSLGAPSTSRAWIFSIIISFSTLSLKLRYNVELLRPLRPLDSLAVIIWVNKNLGSFIGWWKLHITARWPQHPSLTLRTTHPFPFCKNYNTQLHPLSPLNLQTLPSLSIALIPDSTNLLVPSPTHFPLDGFQTGL